MKKAILIFTTLLYSLLANSQISSPSEANEYCPKQEYNFSIDIYATGTSSASYTTSGGVQIVGNPYIYGSRYYYTVKFADNSNTQTVKITYKGNPFEVKYKNIRSLLGGYSHPNDPDQVEVPLCNINPFTLQLFGRYKNQSTNPVSYFGMILKYRFKLPAGWKINNILSTGNNWITVNNTAFTITPDAATEGVIWYIAMNECSDLSLFDAGAASVIFINRPSPTFTLSQSSLSLVCGTPLTKTFSVSTQSSNSCSTSYLWSLGTNNGWLYNGSPAPASFSTPTSSITLTLANVNILPSNVNVTPIVNGVSMPQLQCSVTRAPFVSTASMQGSSVACLGVNTYSLTNLATNNTVTWSSSNTAFASLSNITNSQVTLNGISSGVVTLTAVLTNPCGQTKTLTKNIWVGNPIFKEMVEVNSDSFLSVSPISSNDCQVTALKVSTFQPQNEILETQWEKITQNVLWSRDYSTNQTNTIAIYPEFNINFEFKVRFRNTCGWSDWTDLSYYIGSCPNDYQPPFGGLVGENFIINPVPVTTGNLDVSINPQSPWFQINNGGNGGIGLDPNPSGGSIPSSVIVNIFIYNQSGIEVLSFLNETIPSSLDLSSIISGTYIINFEYQGQIESHTFVKN